MPAEQERISCVRPSHLGRNKTPSCLAWYAWASQVAIQLERPCIESAGAKKTWSIRARMKGKEYCSPWLQKSEGFPSAYLSQWPNSVMKIMYQQVHTGRRACLSCRNNNGWKIQKMRFACVFLTFHCLLASPVIQPRHLKIAAEDLLQADLFEAD